MTQNVLHPFARNDQSGVAPGRNQLLIRLSYEGTPFYGVPPQPGLPSVSETLQTELLQYFGQPIKALTFTARTDKGVHARVNYATGWIKDGPLLPASGIEIAPQSAGLGGIQIFPVSTDVFARTISLTKTYAYRFRDHFLTEQRETLRYWDILPALNVQAMEEAASLLVGTHDFSNFQIRGTKENRDRLCTIAAASLMVIPQATHQEILFIIRGNRFLRRMVRILAGTLAEIGCGLMKPKTIQDLLKAETPQEAGPTAPARGLTLEAIELLPALEKQVNQRGPESDPNKNC